MVGGALILAALVVASWWVDEGEVVTLVTFDARGRPVEHGLWIVDLDGVAYVRAANSHERWLVRLTEQPEVHLERHGGLLTVRGVPQTDPSLASAVDRAMAEKYGFLDRTLHLLRDHSRSVPVRLMPVATASR